MGKLTVLSLQLFCKSKINSNKTSKRKKRKHSKMVVIIHYLSSSTQKAFGLFARLEFTRGIKCITSKEGPKNWIKTQRQRLLLQFFFLCKRHFVNCFQRSISKRVSNLCNIIGIMIQFKETRLWMYFELYLSSQENLTALSFSQLQST